MKVELHTALDESFRDLRIIGTHPLEVTRLLWIANPILHALSGQLDSLDASWVERPYTLEPDDPNTEVSRGVIRLGSYLVELSKLNECAPGTDTVCHSGRQLSFAPYDGNNTDVFRYSDAPRNGVPRISFASNVYPGQKRRGELTLFWTNALGHQVIDIEPTHIQADQIEQAGSQLSDAAWATTKPWTHTGQVSL